MVNFVNFPISGMLSPDGVINYQPTYYQADGAKLKIPSKHLPT